MSNNNKEEKEITPADSSMQKDSKKHVESQNANLSPNLIPEVRISFDGKHYDDFDDENENEKNMCHRKLLHLKTINEYRKFQNYVVLDVETTGLDKKYDKIIEIGMLKIKDGIIVEEYESLVNPKMHIPSSASKINGIFDVDAENAPAIEDIIHSISSFIGDLPIVGHNTNFDVAFIAQEMEQVGIYRNLFYYDTISICKDSIEPLSNYKLETVMKYFGITDPQTHRAIADAKITLSILQKCIAAKIATYENEQLEKKEKKKANEALRKERFGKSTLYNIGFAFTGDFSKDRDILIGDLMSVGGLNKSTVSKSSRYLVKGDISNYTKSALENKYQKAITMIEEGADIAIISEAEFYDLIEEARKSLKQ